MKQRNEILELSFEFSPMNIEFSELLEEKRKYIIARQVLESGTSIGANVREGQSCESRADFVHQLKIPHKEAEETEYWLQIRENGSLLPFASPRGKDIALSYSKTTA